MSAVGGRPDLLAGGHEEDFMTITDRDRIRWLTRRHVAPNAESCARLQSTTGVVMYAQTGLSSGTSSASIHCIIGAAARPGRSEACRARSKCGPAPGRCRRVDASWRRPSAGLSSLQPIIRPATASAAASVSRPRGWRWMRVQSSPVDSRSATPHSIALVSAPEADAFPSSASSGAGLLVGTRRPGYDRPGLTAATCQVELRHARACTFSRAADLSSAGARVRRASRALENRREVLTNRPRLGCRTSVDA